MSLSKDACVKRLALVGNFLPRRCGIATFTTDLHAALQAQGRDLDVFAVAMNDVPEGYRYPEAVRFDIRQNSLSDYRHTADYLNYGRVDLVCVQHEYGIYGGEDGSYVLDLMRELRMPIVTTLHTVLQTPTPGQRKTLLQIAQLSDRLVVMSGKAKEILREVYGVPESKVALIHHGIPEMPFVDPNYYKDQFGVEGKKVVLTFGLLSPGKGIEHMVRALPKIVAKHPDAVYIVLGCTHPHVKRMHGESYRQSLQSLARQLGVADHLVFHDRFVELSELQEFLGCADIYVTPYLNREQITSGTLTYALGAGKAVVSTPYWHAEELLADGRGVLVPFADPDALAEAINALLDSNVERHAMRKRAYQYTRSMVWPEIGRQYLELFEEVRQARALSPKPVFRARSVQGPTRGMPVPKLDHVLRLTDDVGILQHAKYAVPNRDHGYCTDDNARALIVSLVARDQIEDPKVCDKLSATYMAFLLHAFHEDTGRFRNFMSYDRRWLEDVGSEDSHGRALWALGEAVDLQGSEEILGTAQFIWEKALPVVEGFTSPRAWAFTLVGIDRYLERFPGDTATRRTREKLAQKLMDLYRANATEDWPWIEDTATYDNGKVCEALIRTGASLEDPEQLRAGLTMLRWLTRVQFEADGHFVPIGNDGWLRRGGTRARFDQQPLECHSMVDAYLAAHEATEDPAWLSYARACMDWLVGRNDLGTPLYDFHSGGCSDGLLPDRINLNQGAESTLSCLLAMLRLLRAKAPETPSFATVKADEPAAEPLGTA